MKTTMQTLQQAIYLARTGKSPALRRAAWALDGCAVGSWGQTEQALDAIDADIPLRSTRSYARSEFIAAMYRVEHPAPDCAGIYRSVLRDGVSS